jgi:chorismate mutase
MTLEEIRGRIDEIDRQILEKLNQRMSLSLETKKFKTKTKDAHREAQIFDQIKQETEKLGYLRVKFTIKIFKNIIQESRRLQKKVLKKPEEES